MPKPYLTLAACLLLAGLVGGAYAQQPPAQAAVYSYWSAVKPAESSDGGNPTLPGTNGGAATGPTLVPPVPMARMAPELALEVFAARSHRQATELASYSAVQFIQADLVDTHQKGAFELLRRFIAPRTLEFKALNFVGDGFVKTNVIARLLKSEVEHVQKDDTSATALTAANYKFKYKGVEEIEGQPVHVFEVKPRQKRPGLIKGKMFLDVYSGALRRVAGELAKSPSFFVKKLEFVQDYGEFNGFTLPVHADSTAKTRIVGRARVQITIRDYTPVTNEVSAGAHAATATVSSSN